MIYGGWIRFLRWFYWDLLLFCIWFAAFCEKKGASYVWVCEDMCECVWILCENGGIVSLCGDGGIISYLSAVVGVVVLYLVEWWVACFLLHWREKCKLVVFSVALYVVDAVFMISSLTCSFFCWVCCFFVRKKEQAIYEMYKYVVCINVWVCMICFSVWRWRDYIISISSCLSFCLVSCWMMSSMFLITLERKVQINCIFWGVTVVDSVFMMILFWLAPFLFSLLLFRKKKGASYG